jgi:hypothetical protein
MYTRPTRSRKRWTRLLAIGLPFAAVTACTPAQHAAWLDWHADDPEAAEAYAEEWKRDYFASLDDDDEEQEEERSESTSTRSESSSDSSESSGSSSGSSSGYGKWGPIIECESGGDWDYNGGSGYDGGLQFAPSTWDGFGGDQYADYAWQASPSEQIAIAERVLDEQGWGAWPTCARQAGYL